MTSVMTVACAPSGHPGACFLTAEMLNCLSETKLGGGYFLPEDEVAVFILEIAGFTVK